MENLFIAGLILAIFMYLDKIFVSTMMIGINPPIFGGVVTGLIFGDIQLGLYIGAIMTLMSLGIYTYGGSKVPEYFMGAVLGTAVASLMMQGNPALEQQEAINVAIATIAIPASMLGLALSSLATIVCTALVQFMDKKAQIGDDKGYNRMYWINLLLTNGTPTALAVFFGIILGDQIVNLLGIIPQQIMDILNLAGGLMPLLGFGLLLTMVSIKKYWAHLLIGYFLIAYTGTTIIGLSIAAAGIVGIYVSIIKEKSVKKETQYEI